MDGSGYIAFAWGDRSEAEPAHSFRLGLKQIRELQDKTGVGPLALFNRIRSGEWRVDDLYQTIRLGLIGGGMTPPDASKLVATYVADRPYMESTRPAMLILQAALVGADGEDDGKKKAEAGTIPATGSASLN